MSELPDLSAQKPYALDQLAQLQGKIIQLSKSMVLQRARIERCRQSDLAAARDIYAELSRTRETLVETLAQVQLFLMEMEEYVLAKVSGQLRQGLAGFALMSTGYKSVYEALSRFASSLPVGQKTNAAVVGRLMNNIKLGYYPTDPDTPMFFYPFSNVHSDDRVCTGNNVLPRYRKISALKNFPRYLLGLPDNDDMYDREHNRLKLSHGELLEHLKDKDPAYYYTDILVSNGKTLGDFISRR